MSNRLVALNLLLLALVAAAGWRMRAVWVEREAASARFFSEKTPPLPEPIVLVPAAPAAVSPATFVGVAQQMMFSRDRNPTVVLDVEPPKPMPSLPRYYGMMNLGDGLKVILAAAPGGAQKSYTVGEKIGEFKLTGVRANGLIFEWEGKQLPALFSDLRDTSAQPARTSTAPAPGSGISAQAAPKPGGASSTVVGATSPAEGRPSAGDSGANTRACAAGDTSPAGTVADGYRKVVADGPFGKTCFWERVQ